MTKREYAEEIANIIDNAEVVKVNKNGVVCTGITVRTGNISPVVYIDNSYEEKKEVNEVVKEIKAIIEETKTEDANTVDFINAWDSVKNKIKVRLRNKQTNQNAEVFRSAKNHGFADLIIVPYIEINVCGKTGTTAVTNAMLKDWGVTKRTVIDTGIKNVEADVRPLAEVLAEMVPGADVGMFESPFTIVSTPDKQNGAIAIIKAKKKLEELYPNGYYVIPSSIHEVLVLSKDYEKDSGRLDGLVNDANTNVLDATDYLSNHVYTFNVA